MQPVLLTCLNLLGTLAAVRCLGRCGIPVTVADCGLLRRATWSTYVTRRARVAVHDPDSYLQWLLDFGARNPGHVLCPTDDETAWLFSLHREALSRHYSMYSPSFESIRRVLNKQSLHELCREIQIDTPESFFPEDAADLEQVSRTAPYPVIIKPRQQAFLRSHHKGIVIHHEQDLVDGYVSFTRSNGFAPVVTATDPNATQPFIQAYYPEARESIYTLSGFIDTTGELCAVRGSRKVLQYPRRVGVGICFEHVETDKVLLRKLVSLCRRAGYYGVFDVEFLETKSGRRLLMDFNPRFYNQMAFAIAQGLPLPELAYYAATGEHARLKEIVHESARSAGGSTSVCCYSRMLFLMLNLQRLSGRMNANECRSWRAWYREHRDQMVDMISDPGDPIPAVVDAALLLQSLLRHPRSVFRTLVLNR